MLIGMKVRMMLLHSYKPYSPPHTHLFVSFKTRKEKTGWGYNEVKTE
jgi:hypothetical protein